MVGVCAKVYHFGWNEMMQMPKRILFRLYGYHLIKQIKKSEQQEKEEMEHKRKESFENANWKKL
jgi:hypothetical protein